MDRGAWRAVVNGAAKSKATEYALAQAQACTASQDDVMWEMTASSPYWWDLKP